MSTVLFADVAIVVLLLEAVVLLAWRKRGNGPLPGSRILASTAAGLALLAALHAQAAGASLLVVAVALACGGISHAVDLAQRLRDRPAG